MGIPAQQAAKTTRPLMPAAAPAILLHSLNTQHQHHSRNDSTRFRKACIFTTQKALRENTCTIASGDYSTPVSQRLYPKIHKLRLKSYQPTLEFWRRCSKQIIAINLAPKLLITVSLYASNTTEPFSYLTKVLNYSRNYWGLSGFKYPREKSSNI
jgi:hypothetical protein